MVNQTQTLDAEYSVIGALLLQPKIAGELFAATCATDFVRDELRSVYIAARDIWTAGRQLDPVTIRATVGKAYEPLLMACMDTCSSWRMWRDYVAAMQEQTRVGRLHEIADRLAQVQTSDEARDLLADANAAAAEKSGVQVVTMTDALLQFSKNNRKSGNSSSTASAASTGGFTAISATSWCSPDGLRRAKPRWPSRWRRTWGGRQRSDFTASRPRPQS